MRVVNDADYDLVVSLDKSVLDRFVKLGYSSLDDSDKNDLTILVALEKNVRVIDVDESYLFEYLKEVVKEKSKSMCDYKIENDFVATNGHNYRLNTNDQINMIGQKAEIDTDPSIDEVFWKTEDSGFVKHTREEWLSIYLEAHEYKKNCIYRYNALKGLIDETSTNDELMKLEW